MLTPTGVTKAQYTEAINNDALTHVRIRSIFNTETWELTDADIDASGGVTLRDYLNADEDITIGKSVTKELTISFLRTDNFKNVRGRLADGFYFDFGVEINGSTEWVTIGRFYPYDPDDYIDDSISTIVAHDGMSKFDIPAEPWLKNLTYPMTVRQMFESLCTYVGFTGNTGNGLANMLNRSFSEAPITNLGVMCRDVLEAIAEACGCYAVITPTNECRLKWFSVASAGTVYTVDNDHVFDRKTKTYMTGYIGGISVKDTEDDIGVLYPAGATDYIYVIVDNPFLKTANSSDETNYIVPLYNRIGQYNHYPIDIVCVGNPLIEAGDIIQTYLSIEAANTSWFCIYVKETVWNGALTDHYYSTGGRKRKSYTNAIRQKLAEGGRFHIFRNDIDQLYSEIGDVAGDVTLVDQKADSIALSAGKKARMWYSNTAPTGTASEPLVANVDYWINTSDNRKLLRWTGSAWAAADDISKYTKYSGIDINQNGVDITGSKYVKIQSGGSFLVNATNFKIDSTNKQMKIGDYSFDQYGFCSPFDFSLSTTPDYKQFRIVNDLINHLSAVPDCYLAIDPYSRGIRFWIRNKNGGTNIDCFQMSIADYGSNSAYYAFEPPSGGVPSDLGADTAAWRKAYIGKTIISDKIQFVGTRSTGNMIRFVDNTQDEWGNGISIGDGGLVVIGAGESAQQVLNNAGVTGGSEVLYLCSDGNVYIETNTQNGWGTRKEFTFGANGNLTVPGSVIQGSSRERKHDIKPIEDVSDKVDRLEPVSFIYNNDETNHKRFGLIYEDTVDVLPEICFEDGNHEKGIDYPALVPVLLKEIQSLRKRVADLEK